MKKILAMLLAFTMMIAMAMPAFAASSTPVTSGKQEDTEGSIVINAVDPSVTYKIYKILELETFDTEYGAYAYKVADGWEDFFNSVAAKKYVMVEANTDLVKWIWDATNVTDDDPIKTLDDASADFAKKAMAYAKEKTLSPTMSSTPNANAVVGNTLGDMVLGAGENNKITGTFGPVVLGYYLVDSTMGVLCGLTSTDPIGYVNAKNGIPTIDKQVMEDSTGQWGASNTADIGQMVEYRVTVNVHAGAENYVLHDCMESGLSLKLSSTPNNINIDGSKKLYTTNQFSDQAMKNAYQGIWKIEHVVPGVTETPTLVPAKYYTIYLKDSSQKNNDYDPAEKEDEESYDPADSVVVDDSKLCGECSFEIHFTEEFNEHLKMNDKIIIHYNAMLKRTAEIASQTNDNIAWLGFGEGNKTTKDTVKTSTFEFDLVKTNEANRLLDGAEFRMYTTSSGYDTEVEFVILEAEAYNSSTHSKPLTWREITKDSNGVVISDTNKTIMFDCDGDGDEEKIGRIISYRRAREDETGIPLVVNNGIVRVKGMDNGTYWLEETNHPDGYNMLTTRQNFTIADENLYASITGDRYTAGSAVRVQNNTGAVLPETGGAGTVMFITCGMIVVLGAGVLLVTKKRMNMIK